MKSHLDLRRQSGDLTPAARRRLRADALVLPHAGIMLALTSAAAFTAYLQPGAMPASRVASSRVRRAAVGQPALWVVLKSDPLA